MKTRRTTILLVGTVGIAFCQNTQQGDRSPGQAALRTARITAELHPREEVTSLAIAIKMSALIVQAKVINGLPAVNRNVNIPQAIETHSILRVERVLYGKLPAGTDTIILAQEGGKSGQVEVLVPDDPLVNVGDEYILFLTPDERKVPHNTTGVPRYAAVGGWGGKAKIDGGKVYYLPRANVALHAYDGQDASTLVSAIQSEINHTMPTDPNLPIHPGGGVPVRR
jgi:hypothetical protein